MTTTAQTPELLQIINQAIVNLVYIIETFGVYIFWFGIILFAVWLIWNIPKWVNNELQRH